MRCNILLLIVLLALTHSIRSACVTSEKELPYASVPEGFCPFVWEEGLSSPRGLVVADNGDVLVVERGKQQVTVLWEESGQRKKAKLAAAPSINHGVNIHDGFLYASSDTTVYRWRYITGQREDLGQAQTIITGMPRRGNHYTRTLEFDNDNRIYVSCGSAGNIDPTSIRSRVVRFDLSSTFPVSWESGYLFADGLRNEIALRKTPWDVIWGVENGMDNLYRADLGGDIHQDNPSEEVNILGEPGKFYGYPYCWSQYLLDIQYSSTPVGTQWVESDFSAPYTDAWCRDTSNNVPPAFNFPAHTAPMDIIFSESKDKLSFPEFYQKGAFVSFRGSWNRNPADGFRVEYLEIEDQYPKDRHPFLQYEGPGARDPERIKWPHRFVGIGITKCVYGDCIIVASDASAQLIAVGYDPNHGKETYTSFIEKHWVNIMGGLILAFIVFVLIVAYAAWRKFRQVSYV